MKKCLIRDSDIVFTYAISPDNSEFFNKQESFYKSLMKKFPWVCCQVFGVEIAKRRRYNRGEG